MTLKHCIIHHIERTVPGGEISTNLRDSEYPSPETATSLFEQLKQSYMRSSQKEYGHFDSDSDTPLPQWIKNTHNKQSSFTSMSKQATEQLVVLLADINDAFSAHIMFAIDHSLEQDQLYILWIQHNDAIHIDSHLDIASCAFIDSSKVTFAFKLYLDEWLQEDSQKYLSLLTSRGNKLLTDIFERFIGFSSGVDIVADTNEFLTIVDQYADELPEEKTREVKMQILDYCVDQDRQGTPVVFDEISRQLNEQSPEHFSSFVSQQQQEPKAEIHTDRSSLKRYIRFFGRDKNISISFSSDLYGDAIQYDPQSGTLTIKNVPKSLKVQLQKHQQSPTKQDT